jgi:REP element-mobilizing transposase RayT
MRGNNKDYIFKHDCDKAFFMKYLKQIENDGLITVASWCLMDNHVHIVVKAEPDNLGIAFKRLNIKYAMMYHREHNTFGHVFQGRYMSKPIETEAYMLLVTRYIHQNPVKARMVESVDAYKWSSYKEYLSDDLNPSLSFIKALFNNSIEQYVKYHEEIDDREYMEIKEDQLKYREERSKNIITKYCNKYGIIDVKKINGHKEIFDEIINDLIENSGMSLRNISRFIDVPFGTVQRFGKRIVVNKNRPQ